MLTRHVRLLAIHQATWLILIRVLRLLTATAKELLVKRLGLIDLNDVILVKPIAISLVRVQ
jgi:hypothetical protein